MRFVTITFVFVVYIMVSFITMEICNGSVDSVSCVNFEGEPYCYDAGYITMKGSYFETKNFGNVLPPSSFGDGQPFYELAFENSTSNYIYAQFAYDKYAVFQGPQDLEITSNHWWIANFHVTVFLGPLYGLDMPVWSSTIVHSYNYIKKQSADQVKVGSSFKLYGSFYEYQEVCDYHFTFYPTEKDFTGTMPFCVSVNYDTWTDVITCNLGDFEPKNYTFRYLLKKICPDGDYYIAFKEFVEPVKFYK